MEILRNMWRRKFRTFLTIFGIVIGIFAFTVMGSMALKLNKMIDGGKRYITGQISISPKGTDFTMGGSGTSTLPVDLLQKIAAVEGVEAVEGSVSLVVDEPNLDDPASASMNMGQPPTIYSIDPSSNFKNKNWATLDMKEGEEIGKDTAENEIAIGYTVALDKKWKMGDTVKIRGREFKVVGILNKTMTGPDSYVFMNIKPAREMFVDSNPFLKSLKTQSENTANISDTELAKLSPEARAQIVQAQSFKMENISTAASVSWKDGVDSDKLSTTIKDQFKSEVTVLSPKAMGELIDKASATMNAIILGAALLALIVGLFSIVNTMVMSISERTKEIGIKKALGASNRSIAFEYTMEAGLIGFLGGVIGAALGGLSAYLINQKMAAKGAEIFLLDTSFFVYVLIFSFVVGIIAGVIPAMRAAKLKVVEAVREL
ncbi:MAG: FtsX-like permease family protein [Patescibacteria group bacterium]|jgi:putative ABC transport system permease protein